MFKASFTLIKMGNILESAAQEKEAFSIITSPLVDADYR